MAQKTSLRDFQAYLAERLTSAAKGHGASSWLGLQAGETHWLIDLTDSGEIIQTPRLTQVPLTHPWFAGVANIRGNLHSVVDFSMFSGGAPTARNSNARLLLVGTRYGTNAALLVSRMLGLKNPADFSPEAADSDASPWEVARFTDSQGKIWRKLSVRALLENHEYMNIGA
jgi:twitching motility protein PilI